MEYIYDQEWFLATTVVSPLSADPFELEEECMQRINNLNEAGESGMEELPKRKRKQDLTKVCFLEDVNQESNKKKKYLLDETDPNLSEEEKRSIVKAKKCKTFRENKKQQLYSASDEVLALKEQIKVLEKRLEFLQQKAQLESIGK